MPPSLTPARHTELPAQDVGVSLGRSWRDAESRTNLLVGTACRYQLNDLALPVGDRWDRRLGGFVHSPKLTQRPYGRPIGRTE